MKDKITDRDKYMVLMGTIQTMNYFIKEKQPNFSKKMSVIMSNIMVELLPDLSIEEKKQIVRNLTNFDSCDYLLQMSKSMRKFEN